MSNYRVTCFQFGPYPRDSVVPDYVAEAAGNLAELVERGVLTPSNDPVNVEVVVPKAAAPDVSAEMREAHQKLTVDIAELEKRHKYTLGEVDRAAGRVKLLEAEVLRKTEECGHWKAQSDAKDKELAELHKELEQATAPAKK